MLLEEKHTILQNYGELFMNSWGNRVRMSTALSSKEGPRITQLQGALFTMYLYSWCPLELCSVRTLKQPAKCQCLLFINCVTLRKL